MKNKTLNVKVEPMGKEQFEGNFITQPYGKNNTIVVKISDKEWDTLLSQFEVDEVTGYDYWYNEIFAFICRTLHTHLEENRNVKN